MTTSKPQSIFALLGTDVKAEEEGRWFKNIFGTADPETGEGGIDVCIRRITAKVSTRLRQKLEREARAGKTEPISQEQLDEIIAQQLARAIIVDWKGIYDDDGSEIPFSVDNALRLLKKLPNLRVALLGMSVDMDNFRTGQQEAVEGN